MDVFNNTEKYLTKNGEPWIPIMGECHYSRLDESRWKQALLQMKAGGIEVVSTYVIWIHHEEIEGKFLFEGRRDLRRFLLLCQEVGLYVWLRVGPWCHGEVRHGGFPDWLTEKAQSQTDHFLLRYNDPHYLAYVERFFNQIGLACEELIHEAGGSVIGVQVENEYGHAGGYQGEVGHAHMVRLTQMVKDCGLKVPYYTATAWGGACTGGLMPVQGGYCEAPWDSRTTELEPSNQYIFMQETLPQESPLLPFELGGGIQVTGHRRPMIGSKDIGSMALVKIGSGANGLGFYMYHGGTNPKGLRTTLQESKATGYANDYSVYSYDFQAPIGEFGKLRPSYYEIKALADFIKAHEKDLAVSQIYIPSEKKALNFSLRYIKEEESLKGFLFYNHYQRHQEMKGVVDFVVETNLEGASLTLPPLTVQGGRYGVVGFVAQKTENGFVGSWTKTWPLSEVHQTPVADTLIESVAYHKVKEDDQKMVYHIDVKTEIKTGTEVHLKVTYQGDQIQVYHKGVMIHDAFYYGGPYDLDLGLYGYIEQLTLVVLKPQANGKVYYEPGFEPNEVGIMEILKLDN